MGQEETVHECPTNAERFVRETRGRFVEDKDAVQSQGLVPDVGVLSGIVSHPPCEHEQQVLNPRLSFLNRANKDRRHSAKVVHK